MKICFKCGVLKELEEFYKHPKMIDGHLGKCKTCTKNDVQNNYSKNRKYYSEYDKIRWQTKERRINCCEIKRRHRKKNPEKYKARNLVANALRNGTLQKKPCSVCGNKKSEAHHSDYSKPLDVIWVCLKCHKEIYHNQIVTQC